ncbi:hypothetical protein [Sphingomonas sp. MS122]|uniref:tetratricopeptide repeat protein n=1 Tax=Sphingomonas sp. MS122 TaxID=3412683 RepID=UPI003C2D8768
MDEDDLSGLLPKPPPPRPARREAAIAAAMRRFDGVADAPAAPEFRRPRASSGKARWGQIGAFASILLVAVISIPLALKTPPWQPAGPIPGAPVVERQASTGPQRPAGPAAPARETGTTAGRPRATPLEATAAVPARVADKAVSPGEPEPNEALASQFEQAPSASAAPPPPPAPAAPGAPPSPSAHARVAEARESAPAPEPSVVVTGSRVRGPAMQSATPVTVVEKARLADDGDIVVSGTRTARSSAASRRGDWNACTVNDPEQSLRGCRRLVDPAAKGIAGMAAAHLADGLELAWRRDWDRAIGAFDQAIVRDPKLAFAYLNRGLAYQHKGELARAAADLDLAVRHAPGAARSYYTRSVLRRLRGDTRGATADAKRAADLDPRYDFVLE